MPRAGCDPALLLALLALSGCAATATAVGGRHLDVQTRMSDTIFLEPVTAAERTVFVEIKNTSDKPDLDLAQGVREALTARGWRLVDDPAAARFLLQANVLQAGRSARTAAEATFRHGYGSAVSGALVGGAAGYGASTLGASQGSAVVGGALAGAAIANVADAYVQDVAYAVVTDIQVAERAPSGVIVTETEEAGLPQGSAGRRRQASSRTVGWKRYRTRIVSTAERTNLDWNDAAPIMAQDLSRAIAGIL